MIQAFQISGIKWISETFENPWILVSFFEIVIEYLQLHLKTFQIKQFKMPVKYITDWKNHFKLCSHGEKTFTRREKILNLS